MASIFDFDCVFRPAFEGDYNQLHALLSDCWVEVYSPHVRSQSVELFHMEDVVGEHLKLFLRSMEVAVIDGRIVGVINRSDEFVTALAVDKEFRRIGIGSCLLHNANVAGGAWLDVADFNEVAIAFYKCNGWRFVRRFDQDVYGTAVCSLLMSKHPMASV